MGLLQLKVQGFRNLEAVDVPCAAGLNAISGPNASGKTSLLEAIYFLSRGRSFRTRRPGELIGHNAHYLRLVATLEGAGETRHTLGVERSAKAFTARLDGEAVTALTALADALPVLLLSPTSHLLLEGGPGLRRRFIDWGLFQGEPDFLATWRRFRTALRHRNAALKANAADRALLPWERELAAAAATLDHQRQAFCEALERALGPFLLATLGAPSAVVNYRRGWPAGADLGRLLAEGRGGDRRLGHTRLGPQKADFAVVVDGHSAAERLSRGQQKLLVIALVLAQAQLYQSCRGRPCVLLIDDLPAELDAHHRGRILSCLAATPHQLFITAIEPIHLFEAPWRAVHHLALEAGQVRKML